MPCTDGGAPYDTDNSVQERLDKVTRMLCTLANATEDQGFGMINDFGIPRKDAKEIREWLAEHNEMDRERREAEESEQREAKLKKDALKKLTAAERKALGL